MNDATRAAFERLLHIARCDIGRLRHVANFILGVLETRRIRPVRIFAVDHDIARDMATIIGGLVEFLVRNVQKAFRAEIAKLIKL
ncbi:hypothetical protein ACVIHI_008763 [Bradyrhizobium sp. USDA 4524]|uniref:DUF7673 family protein n=1 Tax=unclassified Bradyrhizobium TaxID=2631580 RepID=UPI00209E5581|nr:MULTISPECIES: hypothetical protein [unclassified Bradyrhizobium]MCP1845772.1 hypothetical protein [Bradyrhizobium sp. USDA 4538]MCP1906905.1 hypothetical protein [Bradyrhizobium sp. USDA 4537]MCP1985380.1 hypothetical protein [Bradyrhizobium sp. USDA 4539]